MIREVGHCCRWNVACYCSCPCYCPIKIVGRIWSRWRCWQSRRSLIILHSIRVSRFIVRLIGCKCSQISLKVLIVLSKICLIIRQYLCSISWDRAILRRINRSKSCLDFIEIVRRRIACRCWESRIVWRIKMVSRIVVVSSQLVIINTLIVFRLCDIGLESMDSSCILRFPASQSIGCCCLAWCWGAHWEVGNDVSKRHQVGILLCGSIWKVGISKACHFVICHYLRIIVH